MLSIAVDPFIQNLVGYHTKLVLVPDQSAFVANTARYAPRYYLAPSGISASSYRQITTTDLLILALLVADTNLELKGSIFNALYSYGSQQTWAEPYHTCRTGECTWPPVASIGMCTSCSDTTALVQKVYRFCSTTSGEVNCTLSLTVNETLTRIFSSSLSYIYEKGGIPLGRVFTILSTWGKTEIGLRHVAFIYVDINQQDAADGKEYVSEPTFKSSLCIITLCIQVYNLHTSSPTK
jgi:hypothetical protein